MENISVVDPNPKDPGLLGHPHPEKTGSVYLEEQNIDQNHQKIKISEKRLIFGEKNVIWQYSILINNKNRVYNNKLL